VWTFPTTAHVAGESIREAAERALKEFIGPSQVRQIVCIVLASKSSCYVTSLQ
jgi:ADP-ribose pyrophosphatase YjhB (NUDIX family)